MKTHATRSRHKEYAIRGFLIYGLLWLAFPLQLFAQSPAPKKYPLLFAVNSYEVSSISKLRFAEADTSSIKEVLLASAYEVDLLTRMDATRSAI